MYLPTYHVPLNLDTLGFGDLDGVDEDASYERARDLTRDYFEEQCPQYNVIVVAGGVGEGPSYQGLTYFDLDYPDSAFAEDAEGQTPFDRAWEGWGEMLMARSEEWIVDAEASDEESS